MPLMIFFVNKPQTFKTYILHLFFLFIICLSIYGFALANILSFFFIFVIYSILYSVFLFWKFFVRNADDASKFKNINMSSLRGYFLTFFKINKVVFTLTFIVTLIFRCLFWNSLEYQYSVLPAASFFLMFYTMFSAGIFQYILLTKIISEGVKSNKTLNITSMESIYAEAREILVKNLIN